MSDPKPPVYRALLALKPDGMKLGRWASDAGLARNYFNGLEKHGNATSETIDRLLSAASVTRNRFEEALGHARATDGDIVLSEVRGATAGVQDTRKTFFADPSAGGLPLRGTALGGEYGEFEQHVEMTELHMSEVIDYISRPASLANDPEAYALEIVGDSMMPRFKPGERVGVSTRAAVRMGDDVIIQLRGPDFDGERIKMVLIKELVRRSASFIEVRQYNPLVTFRVPIEQVASIHKVAGNFF